jgi:hypothetical protein
MDLLDKIEPEATTAWAEEYLLAPAALPKRPETAAQTILRNLQEVLQKDDEEDDGLDSGNGAAEAVYGSFSSSLAQRVVRFVDAAVLTPPQELYFNTLLHLFYADQNQLAEPLR